MRGDTVALAGEYEIPKNIFPLPADSSMVFDVFSLAGPIVVTPQATMGGLLPVAGEGARVRTCRPFSRIFSIVTR